MAGCECAAALYYLLPYERFLVWCQTFSLACSIYRVMDGLKVAYISPSHFRWPSWWENWCWSPCCHYSKLRQRPSLCSWLFNRLVWPFYHSCTWVLAESNRSRACACKHPDNIQEYLLTYQYHMIHNLASILVAWWTKSCSSRCASQPGRLSLQS